MYNNMYAFFIGVSRRAEIGTFSDIGLDARTVNLSVGVGIFHFVLKQRRVPLIIAKQA